MKDFFKIIPHASMRDRRVERRIIEANRDNILYGMMIVGGVLLFISIVW